MRRYNVRSFIVALMTGAISMACAGAEPAVYEGDEAGECDDGADNDQDGLYDCDDPGCAASPLCGGQNTGSSDDYEGDGAGECTDGADNDRDGAFDCDDAGCVNSPACGGSGNSGGGGSSSAGGDSPDTSEVLTILEANSCANAYCHDSSTKSAGLDVTTLEGLLAGGINGPSVIWCDPDASTLYTKLSNPVPFGALMPMGAPEVSGTDKATIRDWIAAGEPGAVCPEPTGPMDDAVSEDATSDTSTEELPWDDDTGPIGEEDAYEVFVPDGDAFIHVAVDGVDQGDCGDSSENSCATIAYGLSLLASGGGTLLVHAGVYIENELVVPSGVTVVSADGPLEAKIYANDKSAFRFWQVEQAGLDGLEIYGDWNDGEAADALVRVFDASQITLRNAIIRDAPKNADVVQITGACSGLVLENLILLNPGKQNNGTYQQLLEVFGSKGLDDGTLSISDLTIRGCWFMQHYETGGDDLMYLRASVGEVLIENNVFGPGNGPGGAARPAIQIGTQHGPQPKDTFPETRDVVIRNNIFAGLRGDAALGISNSEWTWVYNNVFYQNSGSKTRSVIMIRGNKYTPNNAYIVNNVFDANMPTKNGGDLYWLRDTLEPANFQHDYNHYVDNVLTSTVAYLGEENSQYDIAAGFDNPQVPPGFSVPTSLTALDGVRLGYLVTDAAAVVNAGIDAVGIDYHPAYSQPVVRRWDVTGEPRPIAGQWDIGIHEPLP